MIKRTQGVVVESDPETPHQIEVFPSELFPLYEGEITPLVHESDKEGTDNADQKYTVKMKKSLCVTAVWLPDGSTKHPPLVRKGERVTLHDYSTDKRQYYWTTDNRDSHHRRGDKALFALNATSDDAEANTPATKDNQYMLGIDTVIGLIQLLTSTDREEFTGWEFTLDSGKGFFSIKNDLGDTFYLNAKDGTIGIEHSEGGSVVLTKDTTTLTQPNLELETKDVTNLNSGKEVNIKTKKTKIESSTSLDIKSNKVSIGNNTASLLPLIKELITITDGMATALSTASNGGGPLSSAPKMLEAVVKLKVVKTKLGTLI